MRRTRVSAVVILKEDDPEACLRTIRDQVERSRRQDPGTESYEYFEKEDGGGLQVLEVHTDANLAHMAQSEPLLARFGEGCDFGRVEILGTPSQPLREIFEGYDAAFYKPLVGFTRERKANRVQARKIRPPRRYRPQLRIRTESRCCSRRGTSDCPDNADAPG